MKAHKLFKMASVAVLMFTACRGTTHEAVALLKVSSVRPGIAFGAEETGAAEADFETYRQTQSAYLTSPHVLRAALRRPGIGQLPSVKAAEPKPDVWLQEKLQVTFPKDGEIMMVSLRLEDPQEAEQLLGAVVDAYMKDVIDKEELERRRVIGTLENAYTAMMEDIRNRMADFKGRARQYGGKESDFAEVDRSIAMAELEKLLAEQQDVQRELDGARWREEELRLRADAATPSAQSNGGQSDEPIPNETPTAASVTADGESTKKTVGNNGSRVKALAAGHSPEMDVELKVLRHRQEHLSGRLKDLHEKSEEVTHKLRVLAEGNIQLELDTARLAWLRDVAEELAFKVDLRKMELMAPSRVTLVQPATITEEN